ncbi:MAG: 4-amino-4-deoxychorismate lyase [Streptosporangiales bacterium]|nr:4-amino-4-deoxychorismate lyase [Streptosporangiales bacterium]
MKVWVSVDGKATLSDAEQARLSVFDHGLTVGDGVFETVKAVDGRPFALTRHLRRLHRSATGLGLAAPDLDAIADGVAEVLGAGPRSPLARVRITVTGGVSPLGSERGDAAPTMVVAASPMRAWADTGDVAVVPWPRNERGALTGLKTTSYGENVRALQHARAHGASEAIFGNTVGNLCEGTGSNVFCVIGGRLVTPPLSAGPLDGITRALVLEWVGGEEQDVPLGALAEAEEAFLTSTTRDVQPIRAVDGHVLPAAPGPFTRRAMEIFAERGATDLDP